MAYNLTAQLNLQAPSQASIKKIRAKIERGLRGMSLDIDTKSVAKAKKEIDDLIGQNRKIKIEADSGDLKKVKNEVDKTEKSLDKADKKSQSFAESISLKGRNFAAYAIASTAIIKLASALSAGTREAIKFEQELAKIAQVVDRSLGGIVAQSDALSRLSVEYNLSLNKIAQVTRTLAQTGLSFREAAAGAEAIAKTSLLATFESVDQTTEGLIATLSTFNLTIREGEQALGAINAVSKRFAVESGDIVEAIRRTGGAYAAANGQINELIAQFTAVRSTSRESAETIATGFRTIFGRLQRPKTIEYFKELGIQLQKANGDFVGPYQAILNISEGLERLGISSGSVEFAKVVEQVGGIRQLSKVVPLLEQATKARNALNIANNAGAEVDADLAKAQQTLGFRFGQLQKNFQSLISEVVQTDSFKILASTFIDLANAAISIGRAIKDFIPLIAAVASYKIGKGVLDFIRAGGAKIGPGSGSGATSVQGYASGGFVPGSGNGDTVPALLTPGEFVINKKSAQAIGYSQLSRINKYAKGGLVQRFSTGGEAQPSNAVTSIEDAFSILVKVIDTMGEEGKKLLRSLTIMEINDSNYRGKYSPKSNTIGINPQYANQKTVAEEAFHALDFSRGQGKKFASQEEGTFENQIAEIAKKTIKYRVEKLKEEGKITEEYLDYLNDPREAYAKFAASSNDTIRSILASQGGIAEKMEALDKALEDPANDPSGLFSGIGVNIAKSKPVVNQPDQQLSKKTLQQEIVEKTKTIKALQGITEEYEGLKSKLKKLDSQIAQGITNSKGQQRAAERRIAIAEQLAQKEGVYLKTLDDLQNAIEDREQLITQARSAKNNSRARTEARGLAAGNQSTFKDFIQGIEKESKKQESALKRLTDSLSEVSTKAYNFAQKLDGKTIASFNLLLQGAVSGLKQFGLKLNQETLSKGIVQGQVFAEGGDLLKSKAFRNFSAGFSKLGKQFPTVTKYFPSFGKQLRATGFLLGKLGPKLAGGLNILGVLSTASAAADALFSKDYSKQLESFIASGNAAQAAAVAQKQYAQELNRSIPLIGGFLNAFQLDLSGIIGGLDQQEAFKQSARTEAVGVRTQRDLQISKKEFETFRDLDFSRQSSIDKRGQAFTGRLGLFDDLIKEVNASKSSSSINSEKASGLGAYIGTSQTSARQATDSAVKGLQSLNEGIADVTKDAQIVAEASATRMFKLGGSLTEGLESITKNIGGTDNFQQLFGFDPSTIKSVAEYDQAIEKARKTLDGSIEAQKASNSVIDKGVGYIWGQSEAEVNKAKISAESAKRTQQQAEAAIELLTKNKAQYAQNQLLNDERERTIRLAKQEIAYRKAENDLRDATARREKENIKADERRDSVSTGIKGVENTIAGLGFGDITQDLQSTLRSQKGVEQLKNLASSQQIRNIDPSGKISQKINETIQTDKALLSIRSKPDDFFKDTGNVKKALEGFGLGEDQVDRLTQAIEQGGSTNKAIDEIRQRETERLGGGAFDALTNELKQVAERSVELQKQRSQDQSEQFRINNQERDLTFGLYRSDAEVRSQFETPSRGGLKVGFEQELLKLIKTRQTNLEGDLRAAQGAIDPQLEIQARQRLIEAHQEELDSINRKIDADIEYQKTVLQARSDLIKDYGFGTRSEKQSLRNTAGFATIAARQGNLQGIPEQQFANIRSFFERFSEVKLPQFGGRKGKEIIADISANEKIINARRSGYNLSKKDEEQIRKTARQELQTPNDLLNKEKEVREKIFKQNMEMLEIEKQRLANLQAMLKLESESNNKDKENLQKIPNGGLAQNIPPSAQGAPNQGGINIQLEGQQEVVVRLVSNGDINAATEKLAYEAVSKKFVELADKIQVTAPELAQSFREGNV